MRDAESLYAWAMERQLELQREADRRRLLRQARQGSLQIRLRIPFLHSQRG